MIVGCIGGDGVKLECGTCVFDRGYLACQQSMRIRKAVQYTDGVAPNKCPCGLNKMVQSDGSFFCPSCDLKGAVDKAGIGSVG